MQVKDSQIKEILAINSFACSAFLLTRYVMHNWGFDYNEKLSNTQLQPHR